MKDQQTDLNRRGLLTRMGVGAAAFAGLPLVEPALAKSDSKLYEQEGKDRTFKELLKRKAFPIGKDSYDGVKGSTIRVNQKIFRKAVNGDKPIVKDISIHTLCNSQTKREDFPKWTRWYQEHGGTQIFRLFKDEHNVRNSRPNAARIEAFSNMQWETGKWHTWEGTYTLVRPHNGAIFQARNNKNDWSVQIYINSAGVVKLNHREGDDLILDRNMAGKSFLLKVRDNGHDYEVYYNKKKVGARSYKRPKGKNRFRWGLYDGTMKHDAMIFVTGARFS